MIDSAATCADIDARAVGKRSLVFANISKKAKFEQWKNGTKLLLFRGPGDEILPSHVGIN